METEPAPSPSAILESLAGELLGAAVRVEVCPGVTPLPLEGTVVDETLHTLLIRPRGATRARRIPKAGLEGTILLGGRSLPLKGTILRVRPEDRTKRLLARGRRSAP
jgi:RNase P/RNase MRP subunit p29